MAIPGSLAIRGGTPVRTTPFHGWPVYGEEEATQLKSILEASSWGIGKRVGKIQEFEEAFAAFHGAPHAVAATNCTQALEVLLQAHGIEAGDEVILPSYTFVAPASAVCKVGGVPVFADIDDTMTMDPGHVESLVGPRTKFLLPVHFSGHVADLDRLGAIATKHGLIVIEDAAQAHGAKATCGGLGNGTGGAAFSFQYSKNMTAGEGGVLLTDSAATADRCWEIVWHGRKKGGIWYEHFQATSNYRITEWQAGVLLAQLSRLASQTETRERNASYLEERISASDMGFRTGLVAPWVERHPRHLFLVRIGMDQFAGAKKSSVTAALRAEGIPVLDGYAFPTYRNPAFIENRFGWKGCDVNHRIDYSKVRNPRAEQACEDTFWILHNTLLGTRADMDSILQAFEKVSRNAGEL